ncbi:exo-beta-N-acetylmuramidase NamZ family protein [Flavihumibacter sp. UBA7668]|uniref:exo-beta-N-acetylmuramidase NamZ family protein n=1 Tax=Flavihumibacter sp. UBA7668 TaxID=1946542 RepID=UPI0025C16924|nr:DUF1343 domain-containing protein [Flavihumibacter sp. UBA7668]
MVICGIDTLDGFSANEKKLRWGLVTNEVALTESGERSRVHLMKTGFHLIRLFSPEHGLYAIGADGEKQLDGRDVITGLPITSLYGEKMAPEAQDLSDLDAILFDIPDVGCRFYTYLWTLTLFMEACAREQKKLIVLDRPNPIGGDLELAEGPLLDEIKCNSFIGRWPIPVRHSCTIGELAAYFRSTRLPGLDLQVIPIQNWNRLNTAVEAGWPFLPTSPAIRDLETAILYPGTGLLEGVFINEGRGTERPFTQLGAPWIDGSLLAKVFSQLGLSGVQAYAITYIPNSGIYAGETCGGIQFQVTDARIFHPVKMGVEIIRLLCHLYPEQLIERNYYTAANPAGTKHLDKLLGVPDAFNRLKTGEEFSTDIAADWKKEIADFLIY